MPKSIPLIYRDLFAACKVDGCPACRIVQQDVAKYLDKLFYESVNDRDLRAKLRESLGFCHDHAWQSLNLGSGPRTGDALGVATIYNDIFTNILRRFPQEAPPAPPKGFSALLGQTSRGLLDRVKAAVQALTPKGRCPACLQQAESNQLVVAELAISLAEEELAAALAASDGLCLPHLRQTFDLVRDEQVYAALVSIHRTKLESLQHELSEFIRKNDYRFSKEPIGPEADSWRRAVRFAAGEKLK